MDILILHELEFDHLAGKIISINKDNKNFDIVSLGHRNAQGLFFLKIIKIIIYYSEHGSKGGDEVNINDLKNNRVPNWMAYSVIREL